MGVTLTSISPTTGPPGSLVTCLGAGFDAGSQVCCPTVVPTTFVDSGTLTATVPEDLAGPGGGSTPVGVFVMGDDGSVSAVVLFTAQFPPAALQSWTTVDAVVAEVPGFARGGRISDDNIQTWIRSVAQEIAAEMVRRGLSMDPATWQQPGASADPDPVDVLETINRMGAGARLAGAIGAQFSAQGEWGVSKNLAAAYARQLGALRAGDYDKFFNPGASTVDTAPELSASTGHRPVFTIEKEF
jgi:hypothetical protein